MDLLAELWKLKNYKLRFITDDGEYEGVLKFITPAVKKITFDKVFMLPNREPFSGTQNFFQHELKSYTIISEPKELPPKNTSTEAKRYCPFVDKPGDVDFFHEDFSDEEDIAKSCDENQEDLAEEGEYILVLPESMKDELPQDSVIIDESNSLFSSAVEHIQQQSTIGVSFEGVCISRFGCLCWIGISTSSCTFLFDILTLKEKAFEDGLKIIFENSKIQKVIHDCRQPSDALYHQYNTKLVNVFDTQVADTFVSMQYSKKGKIGEYVYPLDVCLIRHLKIPQKHIYVQKMRQSLIKETLSVWKMRPITNELRDGAIKNVLYLTSLKIDLLNKMLRSFTHGVDLYLQVVRNATLQELALQPSVPNLVPQSFLMAGLQIAQLREFTKDCNKQNMYKSQNDEVYRREMENPADYYIKYLDDKNKFLGYTNSESTLNLNGSSKLCSENAKLPSFGPKSESKSLGASTSPASNEKRSQEIVASMSAHKIKKIQETEILLRSTCGLNYKKSEESESSVVKTHSNNNSCETAVSEQKEMCWPEVNNTSLLSPKIKFIPAGMRVVRCRKAKFHNESYHFR